MKGYRVETLEQDALDLSLPLPYPFGWPEEMPRSAVNPTVAASFVAMAGQGRLIGVTVTNTKASAQFVQVFDSLTLPADGAVPIWSLPIAAGNFVSFYYGTSGRWFRDGIVFCNSSTQATKTLGAADCLFDVQYVPQVL